MRGQAACALELPSGTTVLKRTQQRAGQCSRTRSTPRRKSAHFCFLLHPPLCSAFICPARAGEASNVDRHLARGDETRKKRRKRELTEHLACSRVSKQSVLFSTRRKRRRKKEERVGFLVSFGGFLGFVCVWVSVRGSRLLEFKVWCVKAA